MMKQKFLEAAPAADFWSLRVSGLFLVHRVRRAYHHGIQ